jgi:hypothetical protein
MSARPDPCVKPPNVIAGVAIAASGMFVGLTFLEVIKPAFALDADLWTSQLATILVGTLLAAGGAYAVLREYRRMCHQALAHVEQRARAESEVSRLRERLSDALAKVISGFVPICSYCKCIRLRDGQWVQVEAYVEDRSEATFTHGLCPECEKRVYASGALAGDGTAGGGSSR